MTVTINILVVLLLTFGLSLGTWLVGRDRAGRADRALASLHAELDTVPHLGTRLSVEEDAREKERFFSALFAPFSRDHLTIPATLAKAAAIRVELAERIAPLGLVLTLLGAVWGAPRRDRARELVRYSSATFSYLGKVLALGSAAYFVFVALSPFAPPVWTLYPASVVAALGTASFVGNLPPKL